MKNEIKISSKYKIGNNNPVFIVAEISKNYIQIEDESPVEEYIKNAKELIKLAKESGADAVKFQTHNVEDEQLNVDLKLDYYSTKKRYYWLKRVEEATPMDFWKEIKDYCKEIDILFFSTPMSKGAAMKLNDLDVPLWKVGSRDMLDFLLLDYIADTKKPIIFSTGMSTTEEIDMAIDFLKKRGSDISLLHCVSKYPCPPEELNLNTIKYFKEKYDIPVGFSDHSIGYDSAISAVNMGAQIIEKHFSINRNLWGADHRFSMTPSEFKTMVERIRRGDKLTPNHPGKKDKIVNNDELQSRLVLRKSLVAATDIKKGDKITKENIYAMRPQKYAEGIPSERYEEVLGREAVKDFKKYSPIEIN